MIGSACACKILPMTSDHPVVELHRGANLGTMRVMAAAAHELAGYAWEMPSHRPCHITSAAPHASVVVEMAEEAS